MAFLFEQDRCMGCHSCQLACKDKHDLPAGQRWRRVLELAEGSWQQKHGVVHAHVHAWYLSISCNHCAQPPCVEDCPTGALGPDDFGRVRLDASVCIGCRYCGWSCPYGAPQYDDRTGTMAKCDGCVDRLREELQPACVDACPVRALGFVAMHQYPGPHGTPLELPAPEVTDPSLIVRPHRSADRAGRR
jgi:anaerobic dimethyl sulfoxide reductase subunit B (iron-sulfur subunit)